MFFSVVSAFIVILSVSLCSESRPQDLPSQLALNTTSLKIPFESCGGNVLEVRAFGCENNILPCKMTRGSTGRVEVDFVPPFDARSLYADVRGRTGSDLIPVYLPLMGFHKEACIGHGITCPVSKNSRQTYNYEMLVDYNMPSLRTDAIWRLSDYWGFTVACFKVDIHISVWILDYTWHVSIKIDRL